MFCHEKMSLYYQESTGKFFEQEVNKATNRTTWLEFDPMHEPRQYDIDMTAEAVQGKVDDVVVKNVAVKDLLKAGSAMKLSLEHLGGPSSMFCLYYGQGKGAALATSIAKIMHMKLIPKLAVYKGHWDENRMKTVIDAAVKEVATVFFYVLYQNSEIF